MQQLLHLMLLDMGRRLVLVTKAGQKAILPMLSVLETARCGHCVRAWLGERQITGELLGQWLGRAVRGRKALDWLIVVSVTKRTDLAAQTNLQWIALDSLNASTALVEYQGWAIERSISSGDLPSVPGQFGDLTWLDRVRAWIRCALGTDAGVTPADLTWHRCGSHEVVIEWRTARGRWFFKGLARDRASEVTITMKLAALMPASFASTAGFEIQPDGSVWWLMAACLGTTLAEQISETGAMRVAAAYAEVQQRITATAHDPMLTWPAIDLSSLSAWAQGMLADSSDDKGGGAPSSITEACSEVASAGLPFTWVAPDLDPTNVMLDDAHVNFIDLDDAMLGPAPLGIATFARRLRASLGGSVGEHAAVAHMLEVYDRAWTPRLRLSGRLWAVDVVSQVLECQLASRRVEAKTRQGEIYGCEEIAQARLTQTLRRLDAPQRNKRPI